MVSGWGMLSRPPLRGGADRGVRRGRAAARRVVTRVHPHRLGDPGPRLRVPAVARQQRGLAGTEVLVSDVVCVVTPLFAAWTCWQAHRRDLDRHTGWWW